MKAEANLLKVFRKTADNKFMVFVVYEIGRKTTSWEIYSVTMNYNEEGDPIAELRIVDITTDLTYITSVAYDSDTENIFAGDMDGRVEIFQVTNGSYEGTMYQVPDTDVV